MSQLGIQNAGPNAQNTVGNVIRDDNNRENIIEAGMKNVYEKETGLDKMEQPRPPAAPKPESTQHKVGRFLTGILGGLLLTAGVAAAVLASVATCGIGGGVVAAVGGILASSLIAGGAGAAGIGLIAGSVAMKPRNPEALLPQQGVQAKHAAKQEGGTVALKFGKEETDAIKNALKTKHGLNGVDAYHTSQQSLFAMNPLYSAIDYLTGDVDTDQLNGDMFSDFTKEALEQFGITNFEVNEKNKLVVRLAIEKLFADFGTEKLSADDVLEQLNVKDVKDQLSLFFVNQMKNYEANDEKYKLLMIFQQALYLENVEIPKLQPLSNAGAGLIGGAIKTVSMHGQAQAPVKHDTDENLLLQNQFIQP